MNNPLISVIVPVYNVEKYLDRCMQSIINQTYKNLEIIVVDDGSTDSCPEKCNMWAEKDSRVKVIHKDNGGPALARNSGIEIMRGEFVIFTDSDDFLENDIVEYLFSLIEKYSADISRCGFYIDYDDGRVERCENNNTFFYDYNERIAELATGGYISGVLWNKLYRSDLVKAHPFKQEDGFCNEDIMFNYRIYRQNPKTVFCDKPKYHYFMRDTSITKKAFSLEAFNIIRAKKIMLEGEKDNSAVYPYITRGYVISAFVVLSGCIQNNAFPEKRKELEDSIIDLKNEILSSGIYTKNEKIKTRLLSFSKPLYAKMIKLKSKMF